MRRGTCLSYVGALLTFVLGVGFLVVSLVVDDCFDHAALQQGLLIALGVLTLITSVIATVGVQKLSQTINKLHLWYVVLAAICSSTGAILDLVVGDTSCQTQNIVAAAVLCMCALEFPIIGITCYRTQVLRESFHESNFEESLNKESELSRDRGVYRINSSRYDTVHWH